MLSQAALSQYTDGISIARSAESKKVRLAIYEKI
jgi:hypothetical protein